MGMDRNTVIGFVLLAVLLFLYLFISTKNSQELQKQKQAYEDSVAKVQALKNTDTVFSSNENTKVVTLPDSIQGFRRAAAASKGTG